MELRERAIRLRKILLQSPIFSQIKDMPISIEIVDSLSFNAYVQAYDVMFKDCASIFLYSKLEEESDETLAFVLAHELTHFLFKDYQSAFLYLPFRARFLEFRADRIGYIACKSVGINCNYKAFFSKLDSKLNGKKAGIFFKLFNFDSSHPDPEERILALDSLK